MNQSIAMDMLQCTSRKRTKMASNTAISLSLLATPTIASNSDPVCSVATQIMPTLAPTQGESSVSHQSTFQNDASWEDERIVATSLKRRRNEMTAYCCHGTKEVFIPKREQPLRHQRYAESNHLTHRTTLETLSSLPPNTRTKVLQCPPIVQQIHETNQRKVRFASCATVTIIPSTFNIKTTCWYERKDYAAFEMDCRQSIIAFINLRNKKESAAFAISSKQGAQQHASPKAPLSCVEFGRNQGMTPSSQQKTSPVVAKRTKCYFTIHGLDDFTSLEAKLLRTRRRLEHCYNVLYHQWILQQQGRNNPVQQSNVFIYNDLCTGTSNVERRHTTTISNEQAIVLQHIAQVSSFQSMRLALLRGQSNATTAVH